MNTKQPHLTLKWGTLKGWSNLNPEQVIALQKYADLGMSLSAMAQPNTDEHRTALCKAIDLFEDQQITNDWTGQSMTVAEAKAYITGYGQEGTKK